MKKVEREEKKQYGHPFSEEETERVLKRMLQPGYRRINQLLLPNASTEEKIKYELCQNISCHTEESELGEKKLGKKLKINQEKVEYILFCHINKLSLEELITYIDKLNIPLEIKISSRHDQKESSSRTH